MRYSVTFKEIKTLLFISRANMSKVCVFADSGILRNFFSGVQQIQLSTEGRENGDLGVFHLI
jgi:hypothetical protein